MKTIYFFLVSLLFLNSNLQAQEPPCVSGHNTITDLSSSLSSGLYYIDADITVSSNIIIEDAEILVAPGVTIYIKQNCSLTLRGVHLFSCNEMWEGIVLDNDAQIVCDKGDVHDNTLIEDAKKAIYLQGSPYGNYHYEWAINAGINAVDIKNTIFNRNRISIDFFSSNLILSTSSIFPPPSFPVSIYNTIFTCRDIPFSAGSNVWVDYETFKNTMLTSATIYPNTPATNAAPYIDDNTYSPFSTAAYLKYPYNASPTKSYIGINALVGYDHQGIYKIGNPDDDPGNTNNVTLFDSHDYGIKVLNTDIKIENCTFQNTPNANPNPSIGLFADHDDEMNFWVDTRAVSGKPQNAFFDCNTAIVANYYTHAHIANNNIRSSKTQTFVSPAPVTYGLEGIVARINGFGEIQGIYNNNTLWINDNELVNIAYPIDVKYDDTYWTGMGYRQGLAYDLQINNNWIALNRKVGSVANDILPGYFTELGINLEVVNYAPIDYLYPVLRCAGNIINLASNGIRLSNWDGKDLRVINNYVSLNNEDANPSATVRGITLDGCIPQNNMSNFIYANTITTATSDVNKFTNGIYINNGQDFTVRCNNTSGLQAHHLYNGNVPMNFFNNDISPIISPYTVTGNNTGLLLNASTIGQQGSAGMASDNAWNDVDWGGITNNLKTLAVNSDVTVSPLFVQAGVLPYDPQDAPPLVYNAVIGFPNYYDFPNGSLQDGAANNYTCQYIPAKYGTVTIGDREYIVILDDSTLHIPINEDDILVNNNLGKQMQTAQQLALGNTPYNNKLSEPALRQYVAQMELYHFLQSPNNKWKINSTVLSQFAANGKNAAFGLIDSINKNIALNKLAQAQQQLANWQTANRVEENYAKFLNWTIARRQKQPINLNDVAYLAQQCPQTDGNVVFAAQNLYNAITNGHKQFITSCDYDGRRVLAKTKQPLTVETINDNKIKVYPNPAKDIVNISFNKMKLLQIADMTGRSVKTLPLNDADKAQINVAGLSKGIYIIKIYCVDNSIATQKLIIE